MLDGSSCDSSDCAAEARVDGGHAVARRKRCVADSPASTWMTWSTGRSCGPGFIGACSGCWSRRRSAWRCRASSTIPIISAPHLELTFGRLRPVHVNGVIFGAFSALFIGECYYLVPRLCGVRVPWPQWGVPLAWVWNITAARLALISLLFGENHGLEAGELPLFAKIPLFLVVAVATAQFLITIGQRLEPPLYVALWYLIGAFVWTTMNLVLGSFILPYTISGINSAAFHGLYIHYIVGLWLTPAGYVLIYYFLPLSVRNPIYAHKLSLVGFWSLALFYPFVGIHHYLYSPIADWAETIAIVTSMLLIIPVWTVLVNFFGTVMGRWDDVRKEPAGEVPDHGRAHVSVRVLPGLDRGPALDPAADPFHRLRHLALAPHRVRHVRGLGDGRPGLCLAARVAAASCGRSRWATGRSG